MYTILVDGKAMHNVKLKDDGLVVSDPTIEDGIGRAGALKFTITPNNPMYDEYKKLVSIITVLDNDDEIFRGRVLDDNEDFYKRKAVVVEGDLNFLLDSIYRPFSFQGDIPQFIDNLISNHNSQVEEAKQFQIGKVTITDPNNYINRESKYYKDTLTVFNEKLIKTHGGYIETRKENNVYYVDFLSSYDRINSQIIEFKKNLLDITKYITAEHIFTVLIPLGAEIEEEVTTQEGETVTEKKRLTIESVNNGLDYIYSDTAIKLFGKIWQKVEYDDVTDPQNLLKKAIVDLNNNIELSITLKLKAVDLHLLDVDVDRLKKGDYVRVVSRPHGLNTYFQLTNINLKLSNPEQSTYEFGVNFASLTEKTISKDKTFSQVVENVNETNNKANESLNKADNIIINLDEDYVSTKTFNTFRETLGTASRAGISNVLTNNKSGYVLDARVGQTILNMFKDVEGKIPTSLGELENDVGFLTEHQDLSGYAKLEDLENIKIPTKLSEFENDEGFLKEHQDLSGYITDEEFSQLEQRIKALEDSLNTGEGGIE